MNLRVRNFPLLATSAFLTGILLTFLVRENRPLLATATIENPTRGNAEKPALVPVASVNGYANRQIEIREAVRSYFNTAIASGQIVGAGVSIVQGDSILLSEGYGKRDSRTGADVDGRTIFRLGSLSKGFTGVLAAKLVQEGKLDWDARVDQYIPEFDMRGNSEAPITLSHILSHSSGAPYHSFTNLIEAGLSLTDIARRFREVTPVGNPGTVYSYQNAIFALSGEMMERATGSDISQLFEEAFFTPLEMCATNMDHEALSASLNTALPHTRYRRGWRPRKLADSYYNAIPAGGINASAHDMARWMRFLLGHNPEVLSPEAIRYAFTPMVEIKGRSKYYQRWAGHQSSYYGFGWRIHQFNEMNTRSPGGSDLTKTIWHHGGSVNGFRNEIALYPDSDLGICVLFNSQTQVSTKVIPDLYKIVRNILEEGPHQLALSSLSTR